MTKAPVTNADRIRTRIDDIVRAGAHTARSRQRAVLASCSVPVDRRNLIEHFANVNDQYADRWFWSHPVSGLTMVGAGSAVALIGDGRGRFAQVRESWRQLIADAVIDEDSIPPRAFSGFRFDTDADRSGIWAGYPDGAVTVPQFLLVQQADAFHVVFSILVHPDDDSDKVTRSFEADAWHFLHGMSCQQGYRGGSSSLAGTPVPAEDWKVIVARGAQAVHNRAMEKVVLARREDLHLDASPNMCGVLRQLVDQYPACFIFAFGAGDSCFIGATPERLIQADGDQIYTAGLAGTAPRGATAGDDERLARDLLRSEKDRIEHKIVVDAIREALEPRCDDLSMPDGPAILSFRNVHHLHTPVSGRMINGVTLLDLVERLHPTPAVGGYPKDRALAFLREHEQLDRGWYASPVGWIDTDGRGEFAVALRSSLIRGNKAALFAGCGIVEDSEPELELAESTSKLRPMISALTGGAQ